MSVVLFLLEDEIAELKPELESIASHPSIHMTAQPCPFEGIEFLYRIPFVELEGQETSVDKSVFWHMLTISDTISPSDFKSLCEHHYTLLVSLLEQNTQGVEKQRNAVLNLLKKYSS